MKYEPLTVIEWQEQEDVNISVIFNSLADENTWGVNKSDLIPKKGIILVLNKNDHKYNIIFTDSKKKH